MSGPARALASEAVIHRVLGAVRFVDPATRAPLRVPLRLGPDRRARPEDGLLFRRNASGDFVIWRAPGLDAHTGDSAEFTTDAAFDALFDAPPPAPAPGSKTFVFQVEDPSGERLGREVTITLPRSAAPADPSSPAPLFTPIEVPLYRSTAARGTGAGAALYVLVHDETGNAGRVPGALVIVRIGGKEVGRGVTGPSGEALVELPALPSYVAAEGAGEGGEEGEDEGDEGDEDSGADEVTTTKIEAAVRVAVLPSLIERAGSSGPFRLARMPDPDSPAFTGPEAKTADAAVTLSAGRSANLEVSISLSA